MAFKAQRGEIFTGCLINQITVIVHKNFGNSIWTWEQLLLSQDGVTVNSSAAVSCLPQWPVSMCKHKGPLIQCWHGCLCHALNYRREWGFLHPLDPHWSRAESKAISAWTPLTSTFSHSIDTTFVGLNAPEFCIVMTSEIQHSGNRYQTDISIHV